MAMLMRAHAVDTEQSFPHRVGSVPAARAINAVKLYGSAETSVRALDGVNVDFAPGCFTAHHGPLRIRQVHPAALPRRARHPHLGVRGHRQHHPGHPPGASAHPPAPGPHRVRLQAFNLLPTLTAAENITLPLALAGRKPDPAWFETVIEVVGLRDRLNHRPAELSGGQQQRVAAARALVSRPEIIFADEPTGNLDSKAGGELLAFMRRAVDGFGQTIVMVTHDPVAASYADRIVFLADGQVVDEMFEPTAEQAIDHMKQLGG